MKHQMTLHEHLLMRVLKKLANKKLNSELTDRETSCLVLAAKGMTSEETANLLGVKSSTVETYRRNIKQKLSCNTLAQAVFEGLRLGYITQVSGE